MKSAITFLMVISLESIANRHGPHLSTHLGEKSP